MRSIVAVLVAAFLAVAKADVYLHSPRGSNDRCDEKSNNRNNDKRCFDSENNAAGGYGICDKEMVFYENTVLSIEWYSQHACGNGAKLKDDPNNPESVHCEMVLQLGCDFAFKSFAEDGADTYMLTDGKSLGRPGADAANVATDDNDKFETFGDTCTQTRPLTSECTNPANTAQAQCANLNLKNGRGTFNSDACKCHPRKMQTYCLHEPEAFYLKCGRRERNKGLFTADQNVNNNNGALRTRQEPNSARYGYECVEERDYWPYWHPSPWIDLAVLTSDTTQCTRFRSESQNQKDKCECLASAGDTEERKLEAQKYNQPLDCELAGFNFVCSGNWNWDLPDCLLHASQPDNSLARTDVKGDNAAKTDGARLAHYDWKIPSSIIPTGADETRCLVRLRYNISTAETDREFDVNDNFRVRNNPVHTFADGNATASPMDAIPLRMAINTAQFGRVFEDRSYVFTIRRRPQELKGKTIHNLNVRGKRGNIAQVRNCFEYDFVPLVLKADVGDLVHFQWCLTDYNDNGNAGEGRQGTDRVNVVPIGSYDKNLPFSLNMTETIFAPEDLKVLAWLNQQPENCFSTTQMLTTERNNGNNPRSCHFLNGPRDENGLPTAYFSYIAKVIRTGAFQFMSSRNNNFTNRSQKAAINVGVSSVSSGAIAGIVIGSVAGVAAIGGLAFLAVKKGGLSFASRV